MDAPPFIYVAVRKSPQRTEADFWVMQKVAFLVLGESRPKGVEGLCGLRETCMKLLK